MSFRLDNLDHLVLNVAHVEISADGARGKMTSVYCRDPDGNLIEVATYAQA